MAKKKDSTMAEEVKTSEDTNQEPQEQLDLIDIHDDKAKPIIEVARQYKKSVQIRQNALAKEVELKTKIRQLVSDAGLKRLDDGTIKFSYDGVTVCITPQDEKVTVKDEAAE